MMTISSTLGWFSRIITMTLELDGPMVDDTGEEFIVPWDTFTGRVALFDCKGCVSGRVKIEIMEGIRVWHTGLLLDLEQYLHYLDPFVSSDLCSREMKISIVPNSAGSAGCWLEGTVYVSFSIPLDKDYDQESCYASYSPVSRSETTSSLGLFGNLSVESVGVASSVNISYTVRDTVHSPSISGTTKNASSHMAGDDDDSHTKRDICRWLHTYNGEAFGLRHSLMVTLCRPWYAHSPELCVPIKLYGIVQNILRDRIRDTSEESELRGDSFENPRPMTLSIVDFNGLCMMTTPSRWVDLDRPILTKIVLRDFSLPVISMTLLLLRTEYIHDAHKDTIVFVHSVFGSHPKELREITPADALLTSGYITRDDHEESSPPHTNTEVEMETVLGPSLHPPEGWCSSNRGGGNGSRGGGNEPVQARDGACATFILNFPMGNAPDTSTPPSSSSGTASTPSVSSSAASDSVDLRSVPKGKSTLTYADKMRLIDENNKEVEMRLSRLSPSFDATQQDGEPFALHIAIDSDDEGESEDESEEEAELVRTNKRPSRPTRREGVESSSIELQDLSLSDPEQGGMGMEGGKGEGTGATDRNGTGLGARSEGQGSEGTWFGSASEEIEMEDKYLRAQYKKQIKIAKAALKKKQSRPYFEFLGDSVTVRYFLRLIIEDSEGECRWNTEEIVLYRSKAPHVSRYSAVCEGNEDTQGYGMTAV